MKRILALGLSVLLALSMCACDDKDDKKTTTTPFKEVSPDIVPQFFTTDISENTFASLGKMEITCNSSNIFYANIYCDAPKGVAEGFYSSPEVTASVDGVAFDVENSAYINVSSERATISVSAFVGYVKEGSEITVSVKNFNKLNEQDDETVDYNDISDEVVISGSLTIKSKSDINFGHLRYDLSDMGADLITISEKSATVTDALQLLGDAPEASSLVIVLKDNSEVAFDTTTTYLTTDDDEATPDKTNVSFFFEGEKKQLDLGEIADVKINGTSVVK